MRIYRLLCRQARVLMEERLDYYSQFNPSPLSMQQFTDFGVNATNTDSFLFLRKELPVRLANIMKEFHLLPEKLLHMPSMCAVRDLYRMSFKDLLEFENGTGSKTTSLDKFTDALIKIRNRHKDVVMTMAQGVMELKEAHSINANTEANIQYFLDRFYMNRISIRMLINQHTILFGEGVNTQNHIGCIDPHCDVVRVIEDAYSNARFLCDQYYLASPELVLKYHNEKDRATKTIKEAGEPVDKTPVSVVYVPSHLYHMLFELFKNAMRAVVEYHSPGADVFPPVEVLLVMGQEDLTIKLCDQGGGIPRSQMDLPFNYMYSTAPQPAVSGLDTPPLAGYGYGLPLSRLYARYFHGDLMLTSCEGYGTDAIIFLKALSSEANELLPVYNKTCQRQYSTPVQTHDWSSQMHSAMFIRPFSTNSKPKAQQVGSNTILNRDCTVTQ
ncbi:pyruvate dehydrogenase (acetyl-transferring) kinase, mitochondrial-like isoform X1 [Homarus americanus]|uniref:pyruvate dehydrogenase (acetyl-transferring) kinase, mitochondrial-like isoform X1 n=1 Tax=Homarus americanus TaxID=6706 RepID=UPI001C45C55D|nr:pyruvate dehydrogenase (acetyl-transferring) kinase, mitochondrial-like isoform X1 [Homarus americanus]